MTQEQWIEELMANPKDYIYGIGHEGRYYQKIKSWEESNKKRKQPRTFHIFKLDEDDANKNATFSTYELGIKEHIIARAYLTKIAGLLPMSVLKDNLLRFTGIEIEENVFIAPEVTIDPVLKGWIRFRKGASIGWGAKCFNHLFEDNGRVIIGYVDIGEKASVGGYVSISPGVTIEEKVNIGAEVRIAPGVTIKKGAKIGAGAFLSPFITVEEGAEVQMGSVVLESVKAYTKVQGNPAKEISKK